MLISDIPNNPQVVHLKFKEQGIKENFKVLGAGEIESQGEAVQSSTSQIASI
jgi:hypothetical protein